MIVDYSAAANKQDWVQQQVSVVELIFFAHAQSAELLYFTVQYYTKSSFPTRESMMWG